ncbi:ABC transporter permease [Candidatus Thorarchaeota archaeon]|nr:MAG: ABC transporter permease [Candidatus Thorarchaeota archaeon]
MGLLVKMSEQDYASKDLKRRPFRTSVVLLSITTIVGATTFLFLFSNVMLDVTSTLTSIGLASALGVFFETFIWSALILIISLGVTVVSSNISLEIVSRRKDIGLMKSIGTLIDTIFDHFMAQSVIILGIGTILGIALGTLLYILGLIWLAFAVPGLEFVFVFPWVQILLIAGLLLFVGYFAAQKPIYDAVHESPIGALNPDVGMKVKHYGLMDSFGLPFKIATKGRGRRIRGTRRTILSLFLSFSLASVLLIGGGIVQTTMDSYVTRSMGENVVAIGDPGLLNEYYDSYRLTGNRLSAPFNYTGSQQMIPEELMLEASELSVVSKVEGRLVQFTEVAENPAIIWNPTLERYERIGGDRVVDALVIGIDWENTISEWYFEGAEVNTSTSAWIGGEMAAKSFEDPLIQSVGIGGSSFEINGIAFEILNGGRVALIPLAPMQDIFHMNGVNLMLIQLNRYTESAISQIRLLAEEYGLSLYEQQEILEANQAVIISYWGLMQPIPIMALVSAFLGLMYYLLISVFSRFRDYVVMRSVGASPTFIAKTIIAEGLGMGMKSGVPALFVSIIFSVFFLVPEASVPSLIYLPLTAGILLLALLAVIVIAAIPVYLIFMSRTDLRVSEFAV